ncbi:MAG TPA: HAD-IC family P-type ATPase [Dehalococcoidia bacterium]|nr:HAD-IC family P-type ATPase [Dehalococcoidia bacterium]
MHAAGETIAAPTPAAFPGLSSAEAADRALRGLSNRVPRRERSDLAVLRENATTFFNLVLGSLVATLLVLAVLDRNAGLAQDALFVGLVAIANIAVGTFQELRAVRTLRGLVALAAPHATVVRDGEERRLPAEEVVQGDRIVLRPGDQVVADGPIVAGAAEIDESQLSGEAKPVPRRAGGRLRSGSFCTAGTCAYIAEAVGGDAYAQRLTAEAQELVRRLTPLQLRFNRILRVLLTATMVLGGLLLISYNVAHRGFAESVRAATATISSVVPEGLLLSMTVAFAIGAVRVSRRGAIVQEIGAVEALNYVDVVCLDKTGTITANALSVAQTDWQANEAEWLPWLGAFATASAGESRTADALTAAFSSAANGATTAAGVPFSSARRWSARTLTLNGERRTLLLGAPETVLPLCTGDAERLSAAYDEAVRAGRRGVVLAAAAGIADDEPVQPVEAVALIVLADTLRPEIGAAFATMDDLGIEPKIISGDNPQTVAALVAQLGIRLRGGALTGAELETLDPAGFAAAVEHTSIFGRIAPAQKAGIVAALRGAGHYVAMVGDGVNDVPALRSADLAIAMQSGADTARAVAGMVLTGDSFAAFVAGTQEARAVLGNAARLSKLFLAKSLYAFLIIVATNMLGLNFPFLPRHGSLTALLTLGIPAVFISMSVPPRDAGRDFTHNVLRFALPAAFAVASVAIVVHLVAEGLLARPIEEARTLDSLTVGITGLFFMLEVLGFAGASLRNPTRPVLTTVLGAGLFGLLLLTLYTPWLRRFFDFTPMDPTRWAVIGPAVAVALIGQYLLSRQWPAVLDFLTARPRRGEIPRGRTM